MICKPKILRGDAWQAINLNPNNSGELATAKVSFLQQIVQAPVNYYKTAWEILLKSATGYTWIDLGKKSAPEIKQTLKDNPQLDNALTEAFRVAKNVGEVVTDYTAPYIWAAKYAPYIVTGLAIVLVIWLFQNPGSVKPDKVSLF